MILVGSVNMHNNNNNILVRTSKGLMVPFNREKIVKSLIKETGIEKEIADEVAFKVEVEIRHMDLKFLSAPLIREIVNVKLLEKQLEDSRKRYTRVGLPVADVEKMIFGNHKYSNENANLQQNPETVHKLIADNVIREYSLLRIIPTKLGDMHMRGAIHIHDLDYFPTRPFCQSHDARFFFKNGFIADGTGTHTAVAGPAKRAEVALLHALKVLQASQVNCGGGQGLHDFNLFMAPYLRGMDYEELKQIAQTMFFELGEMYVARGGQTVFSSVSVDPGIPKTYADLPAIGPEGKVVGVYGDYEEENRRFF
ncbi:anaerobic ribonucleoside-triphosphate reductase, partial [Candidatus Bathyarchaeota archaeon]|nr:anaerobic ribonucleoside-triphosphate reductase [Candidatus Bathyarchaeota archaeon]